MNTQNNIPLSAEELQRRIDILRGQTFYLGDSYFPERSSKNNEERFQDLVEQIKKYGWPDFQYLLYGMDVKTKEECDQYVNAMEFVYRRNYLNFERNPFNSCCILRNKFYFGIYASAIGIKTPENIGFIENGVIHSVKEQFKEITLKQLLEDCPDSFCKSLNGENGEDVFHLQKRDNDILMNGNLISPEVFKHTVSKGSFLVQRKIYQHERMNQLYPLSINTIRIVTVRNLKTGVISIWPSMFRMGAGGSHIDNASKGGIVVNINPETGKLSKFGCRYSKFGGGRLDRHPDTGVVFYTFDIPYFEEVKRTALYFHSMLKDIHSIGWDIAITPDGPAYIEGNDDWSIVQSQLDCGVRNLYEKDFF